MENRTYFLRFRKINRDIFLSIKSGKKKIETRAATPKYRKIKQGDLIIFSCSRSKFKKSVKITKIYRTITGLAKVYKIKDINPFCKSIDDLKNMYFSFPGYRQKIKKYGILVLELK